MASQLSKVYSMEMPADRSEYNYPITNITYHLPESPHPERGEAAAQKAFRRILDSYSENERLADTFQVELDKRTQIANERKAEERRVRLERQRVAQEEKRSKKLGKNHKAQKQRTVSAKFRRQSLQQPYEHDECDKFSRGHKGKWGADGGFEIEFVGIRSSSPSPFPASS
ncbi:hypothetical protein EC957_000098 [Mortierella hygrophila]|uniref:Uncharacterized protein n=1 Tax=Mortierella hygrophila TaxID=979708 RepID=A0A9P6FK99_9FUNG|nr:hypothetical protein EC957_000098 [Mortierella hygrophila]